MPGGIRRKHKRHLLGALYPQHLSRDRHGAALGPCAERHGKLGTAPAQIPVQKNPVVPKLPHPVKRLAAPQPGIKGDFRLPLCGKPHDNTVRRLGRKELSAVLPLTVRKPGPAQRAVKLKASLIARHSCGNRELTQLTVPLRRIIRNIFKDKAHRPQRLIGVHTVRAAAHGNIHQPLRPADFPLFYVFPDFGQVLRKVRIDAVDRAPVPHTFLIELQLLSVHAAIYHGAQPSVSDRQRFLPLQRGLPVPQSCHANLPSITLSPQKHCSFLRKR